MDQYNTYILYEILFVYQNYENGDGLTFWIISDKFVVIVILVVADMHRYGIIHNVQFFLELKFWSSINSKFRTLWHKKTKFIPISLIGNKLLYTVQCKDLLRCTTYFVEGVTKRCVFPCGDYDWRIHEPRRPFTEISRQHETSTADVSIQNLIIHRAVSLLYLPCRGNTPLWISGLVWSATLEISDV